MGLFQRVESGIERAFGGLFGRTFKANVEPVELAAKLVKEMEDHKTSSVSRIYVPNQFTIFLCTDDRAHLRSFEQSLAEELEAHVLQHARTKGYALVGPPSVRFKTDSDLKLGQFGILAENAEVVEGRPTSWEEAQPAAGGAGAGRDVPSLEWDANDWHPEPIGEGRAGVAGEGAMGAGGAAAAGAAAGAALGAASSPPVVRGAGGRRRDDEDVSPPSPPAEVEVVPINPRALDTQDIPLHVAADLDLARHTIMLSQGRRTAEFHKGRVLMGRAKSADFQLDDPNVSRQHAAVYWEQGRLYVKDLGSTNGTLLNGKPVTAGPLASGDVLTLGDTEVTVETG